MTALHGWRFHLLASSLRRKDDALQYWDDFCHDWENMEPGEYSPPCGPRKLFQYPPPEEDDYPFPWEKEKERSYAETKRDVLRRASYRIEWWGWNPRTDDTETSGFSVNSAIYAACGEDYHKRSVGIPLSLCMGIECLHIHLELFTMDKYTERDYNSLLNREKMDDLRVWNDTIAKGKRAVVKALRDAGDAEINQLQGDT